jgi:hypothetical protein
LDTESHHDFELGKAQGLSLHHLGTTLPSHQFSMSVSALPASQRRVEIENIYQARPQDLQNKYLITSTHK